MGRHIHSPPRVTKPRLGEYPSWWAKFVGIRCPNCGRPQSPTRMDATNPQRRSNRTDFHMCGGCGRLLYLTGERRLRRFYLLHVPVFLVVVNAVFSVLVNFESLSYYHEARGHNEPNFLGFPIICVALFVSVSALLRFEIVGVATSNEIEKLDAQGDQTN